jgi:hypothetical protein
MVLPMSNASVKVAIALLIFLTSPAASFARGGGGHGGGHAGFGAMRSAGAAGAGNVPISGIAPGPGNVGGIHNITVDPSGIGGTGRLATLAQPHISAPTPPGGSPNPAALSSMNVEPQMLGEESGGHSQPRAGQVPSENDLIDPNSLANRHDAAFDRSLNICQGC